MTKIKGSHPSFRELAHMASYMASSVALFSLLGLFVSGVPGEGRAGELVRRHGLSLIDQPKYPRDFKHFDYVNADAPKGGSVRLSAVGSFDNLNPIVFKGVAATGLGLIYETLMDDSIDEPSTSYGLIAEWASYPEDYSSVTFKLRDSAKWHDGMPITVEDVIFSLQMIKKANPRWGFYYKNISGVEKTTDRQVTFSFDVKNNRELPMITGQLLILPKHYWTATRADGKPRDLLKTTLEVPLGSGPYRIKQLKAGRSIAYQRVKDYWGKDLPVNVGRYNFDDIRFEYFRDQTVSFEAFKADQLDYYDETSSKNWATAYEFKAIKEGWVKKQEVVLKTSQPMQAFVPNLRRSKFADAKVRRALNLAFNFEWTNKNLFYGQYSRLSSYFQNTELASSGLADGQELEILNGVKDLVPEELFTKGYKNPVNQARDDFRKNLREARLLLEEAGWQVTQETKEGGSTCGFFCKILHFIGLKSETTEPVLRDKEGRQFLIEFLLVSPSFERVVQPYARNLERLGIQSSIRIVDSAQYKRRLDNFDYDVIVASFPQSHSPGNEQRSFWGTIAADQPGSRNFIGIKNPAVDQLIDKIIFARDRAELVAATRALDRVLLWNHYLVPQWFAPYDRIAYWQRFAHSQVRPSLRVGFLTTWWYDREAAEKLARERP